MREVWRIDPCKSLGPLALGATREKVEAIYGSAPDSFKRGDSETVLCYPGRNLHVSVNRAGSIVEIAAFQPREVTLAGVPLLGRPPADVQRDLMAANVATEPSEAGLYCRGAGVVLVVAEGVIDGVELRAA